MKHLILAIISTILISSCKNNSEFDPFSVCKDYDQSDIEMEKTILKIKEKYADQPIFLARLQDAQVAWIQYRSRRVRALYPKDWDRHYRKKYGRDKFNPCKCEENLRLVSLRVKELEVYLDNAKNNDCPDISQETIKGRN